MTKTAWQPVCKPYYHHQVNYVVCNFWYQVQSQPQPVNFYDNSAYYVLILWNTSQAFVGFNGHLFNLWLLAVNNLRGHC